MMYKMLSCTEADAVFPSFNLLWYFFLITNHAVILLRKLIANNKKQVTEKK